MNKASELIGEYVAALIANDKDAASDVTVRMVDYHMSATPEQPKGLEVVGTIKASPFDYYIEPHPENVIEEFGSHDVVLLSHATTHAEQVRAETIEECAEVLEGMSEWVRNDEAAKAIRALGEKK
jgi:hypothetical protein